VLETLEVLDMVMHSAHTPSQVYTAFRYNGTVRHIKCSVSVICIILNSFPYFVYNLVRIRSLCSSSRFKFGSFVFDLCFPSACTMLEM